MLKLYYKKGACPLVVHTALEWVKMPYESQNMELADLKSPDFLKLNPQGQVPLLQDGDWVLTQNMAILDYLNEMYPEAKLFGSGDSKSRAKARQWLAFVNSDIHKTFGMIFRATVLSSNEAAQAEIREYATTNILNMYQQAENVLTKQDWLAGELTIADIYLYVTVRWAKALNLDLSALPALLKWFDRVEQNAGVQNALKQQGLLD